jgi:hypothetical protein
VVVEGKFAADWAMVISISRVFFVLLLIYIIFDDYLSNRWVALTMESRKARKGWETQRAILSLLVVAASRACEWRALLRRLESVEMARSLVAGGQWRSRAHGGRSAWRRHASGDGER